MAVNDRDKASLGEMWDESGDVSEGDFPNGDLQFLITEARFHTSDNGNASYLTTLKVIGGNDDFVGQETEVRDNLNSVQNMQWFKKKLRKLGVEVPESVKELEGKEFAASLVGQKFDGTVKTKDEFMNIYVKRSLGKDDIEPSGEEGTTGQEEGSETFEKGDLVQWADGEKKGEFLEFIEDGARARVQKEGGGVVRVPTENLEAVYEEEDEEPAKPAAEEEEEESASKPAEEEEEESPASGSTNGGSNGNGSGSRKGKVRIPKPGRVEGLKKSEIDTLLKQAGFKPSNLRQPRDIVAVVSGILHKGGSYRLPASSMAALCQAFGITKKRGASPSALSKSIRQAATAAFKA